MRIAKMLMITFLFVLGRYSIGQAQSFYSILNKAKQDLLTDTFRNKNYKILVSNLKRAVAIQPNSAEAHYLLAYAYSRLNSSDAKTIPDMQLPLVIKMSTELEKANKLAPLYGGETLGLGPYSKISSEWGAMALNYLYHDKPDSAKWALAEGKKRGGFDDFILSVNKEILERCSQNSILVPSGDDFTLPLYYLQLIDHVRLDITIVDMALLGTRWYPQYLLRNTPVKFGLAQSVVDTLEYKQWRRSLVTINLNKTNRSFIWTVKPSYQGTYLLRGDLLFLALLKENQFNRDVYFTKGFAADQQLSLDKYLLSYPLVDKINIDNEKALDTDEFIKENQKTLLAFKPFNKKSKDDILPIDIIRISVLNKINKVNSPDMRERLILFLRTYLSEKSYPCYNSKIQRVLNYYLNAPTTAKQ